MPAAPRGAKLGAAAIEAAAKPPAPTPPPFDAPRAAVYAIGIGVPVAACLHFGGPAVALFAGVGAMNALVTDPRRRVAARVVSIACAMAAVLAAAAAGDALRARPDLALALAVLLAYPAGLVPPLFPYVSMVAKLLPLAVIVVATGVFPGGHVLAGFAAGTLFAAATTLVEGWLRPIAPYADPLHELVALWRGRRNSVAYAIAYAGAVALALAIALALAAPHPLWAVVATLFVMHPDYDRSLRRIGKRIAGTLVGVAVAWGIVHVVGSPWALVAIATLAASLLPWTMARSVFAGTLAATVFLLVLFDVGMIAQGGDRALVLARLWDTLIGSAAVAVATVALRLWRRGHPAPRTPDVPDPIEPAHAGGVEPLGHL